MANNKLLIADNKISESTTEGNEVFEFIGKIMNYFSSVAQLADKYSAENFAKTRKEIFLPIFEKKLSGEGKGYFNPIYEYKNFILTQLNHILNNSFNPGISKKIIKKHIKRSYSVIRRHVKHSRPQAVSAYEMGLDIIRRIKKIEKFLSQPGEDLFLLNKLLSGLVKVENEGNLMKKGIVRFSAYGDPEVGDIEWINNESSGYGILAINENGVHAESKVIDFLLATGIINNNELRKGPIYIGISKACCLNCSDIIEVLNQLLKERGLSKENYIYVTDAHLREFKWLVPLFLSEEKESYSGENRYYCQIVYEGEGKKVGYVDSISDKKDIKKGKESKTEYIAYQKRNISLEEDIKSAYKKKQPKFYLKLYQNEKNYDNHNATHKKAKEMLVKEEDSSCLIVYYYLPKKKWYFIGLNFQNGKIEHIELDEFSLDKKRNIISAKMKSIILIKATELFGRKIEPKKHMSQESESSTPISTSEHEEETEIKIAIQFFRESLARALDLNKAIICR